MIEELFFDALQSAFLIQDGAKWSVPETVAKGIQEAHSIKLEEILKKLEYILANEFASEPWSLDEFLDHQLESLISLQVFLAKKKKEG